MISEAGDVTNSHKAVAMAEEKDFYHDEVIA